MSDTHPIPTQPRQATFFSYIICVKLKKNIEKPLKTASLLFSRKSHSKDSDDNTSAPASVKDRIRAFEAPLPAPRQGEVKVREGIKPRKNKPTSKAFTEFESKGILIGFVSLLRLRPELLNYIFLLLFSF